MPGPSPKLLEATNLEGTEPLGDDQRRRPARRVGWPVSRSRSQSELGACVVARQKLGRFERADLYGGDRNELPPLRPRWRTRARGVLAWPAPAFPTGRRGQLARARCRSQPALSGPEFS